jgi:hypothetical protein
MVVVCPLSQFACRLDSNLLYGSVGTLDAAVMRDVKRCVALQSVPSQRLLVRWSQAIVLVYVCCCCWGGCGDGGDDSSVVQTVGTTWMRKRTRTLQPTTHC